MRVLLADDHKEIRLLTAQQLQHSGHQVVAVSDGQEALTAFEHERFDIVILDEQMPLMDGVQAVRAIRLREKVTKTRSPIIALTGNCSDPDRVRLLNAGFDAVIGKPFRLDSFVLMVESLAAHDASTLEHATPIASGNFDSANLVQRVAGGDPKLLRQVIRTFLRDLPKRLTAIDKAIEQKRADTLASAAHALKGSVGMFGAEQARQLCARLQERGRSNTLADAGELFAQLNEQIAELEVNLRRYAGQTGSHQSRISTKTERSRLGFRRKTP